MAGLNSAGLGTPVPRWEDERLMTGRGNFADDIPVADCMHAVFVRSPWPHARILRVESAAATIMPGVAAILTGEDVRLDGLGDLPCHTRDIHPRGQEIAAAPRPVLARGKVRFVGEPVAVVVAATRSQAEDAAEQVHVDYEPLEAVAELSGAADGPLVWDDLADNRAFSLVVGNEAAVGRAFSTAIHRVVLDLAISRVTAAPLETRTAIGFYDSETACMRLVAGTQSPHLLRTLLARDVFGFADDRLTVQSPDVGGSFGLKNAAFPELAVVLWTARRLGRPVRWLCGRNESFMADDHARDNLWTVALALDADGIVTGLKAELRANLGAYLSTFGAHCPLNNLDGLVGPYTIPTAAVSVEGYYTNTPPVSAYRGAGRPEACYAIERTMDVAALQLGIDRIELRRRNLVAPGQMPWRSALGAVFDSGDFPANMAKALEAIGWADFPSRRAHSERMGRLRGIGLAHHIESSGSTAEEMAELRFSADGNATLLVGVAPQGQGHETMLRQLAAELFGLDPSRVRIIHSDTDAVDQGQGTFGSRSASVISAALAGVKAAIVEKATTIAAAFLHVNRDEITFVDGQFLVRGTRTQLSLEEVARASFRVDILPRGTEPGLAARYIWRPKAPAFPSGCHVCEIEIDPGTCHVSFCDYVAVEDCGRVINPLLVEGQLHGGIVQGIGQALMEEVSFDETGQLVSGSFMDYAMPRASELPFMRVHDNPHPTSTNPLGIKGAGESGTVGAMPAVMSAVLDALNAFGIAHLDMPASPRRLWSAIRDARSPASVGACGGTIELEATAEAVVTLAQPMARPPRRP